MTTQVLTPTTVVNPTGMTTAAIAAMRADVATRTVIGQAILASDMAKIQQMYNAFATHTHDVPDIQYIAFGVFPAYPSTSATTTSNSAAKPTLSLTFTPVTGTLLGTDQSSLSTALNNIRIHTHSILDHILP